MADGGYRTL